MGMGLTVLSNFLIYQAFLSGIYNYRQTELLNMRRVPLPLKLAISTATSGFMGYLLYNDHLYNNELYTVSLKYRKEYDEEYNNYLKNESIDNIYMVSKEA